MLNYQRVPSNQSNKNHMCLQAAAAQTASNTANALADAAAQKCVAWRPVNTFGVEVLLK